MAGPSNERLAVSCEACNDVVKKPKLDAHKGRCRDAVFSCIDCSTTFQGTDYRSHTVRVLA